MDSGFQSGERPKPVTAATPTSLDMRRGAEANAAMVVGIVGLTSVVWIPVLLVLLPPQTARDQNVHWGVSLLSVLLNIAAITMAEGTRRRGGRIPQQFSGKVAAGMICGLVGMFAWMLIPWITWAQLGLLSR